MAVGTGAYTEEAIQILTLCGLLELVDHVVGADQVDSPKPAPDTFLRCAELMGIAPARCIVFEDARRGCMWWMYTQNSRLKMTIFCLSNSFYSLLQPLGKPQD